MVNGKVKKAFRMRSGILMALLVSLICVGVPAKAQLSLGMREYSIKQVYDANGNPINNKVGAPSRIKIAISTSYMGSYLSHYFFNDTLGMYDYSCMTFNYRGINNGWYIYDVNLGLMGHNFIYVNRDASLVRVCMSFYNGMFVEYRPYVPGEDINMTPTQ